MVVGDSREGKETPEGYKKKMKQMDMVIEERDV